MHVNVGQIAGIQKDCMGGSTQIRVQILRRRAAFVHSDLELIDASGSQTGFAQVDGIRAHRELPARGNQCGLPGGGAFTASDHKPEHLMIAVIRDTICVEVVGARAREALVDAETGHPCPASGWMCRNVERPESTMMTCSGLVISTENFRMGCAVPCARHPDDDMLIERIRACWRISQVSVSHGLSALKCERPADCDRSGQQEGTETTGSRSERSRVAWV